MGVNSIQKEIRQYVFENFIVDDDEDFSDDESFLESGLIDSTGILELITFVEENYEIEIEDEEMIPDNLDGIAKVAGFVASKMAV
jgi:acyl carrier protein